MSFAEYSSASILLQSANILYRDLEESNGVELKILQNELRNQSAVSVAVVDPGLTELDLELEKIETLIVKMSEQTKRADRRRLLSEYNSTQIEEVWGT